MTWAHALKKKKNFFLICFLARLVFVVACRLSLVVASGDYSLLGGCGLCAVVASLVNSRAELMDSRALELQASVDAAHGLSGWRTWVLLPCGMWNLPRPGVEPVSPALAGRFLTTEPQGKSWTHVFWVEGTRYLSNLVWGYLYWSLLKGLYDKKWEKTDGMLRWQAIRSLMKRFCVPGCASSHCWFFRAIPQHPLPLDGLHHMGSLTCFLLVEKEKHYGTAEISSGCALPSTVFTQRPIRHLLDQIHSFESHRAPATLFHPFASAEPSLPGSRGLVSVNPLHLSSFQDLLSWWDPDGPGNNISMGNMWNNIPV